MSTPDVQWKPQSRQSEESMSEGSTVGILAMGSHREKHGAALPQDTDAKIAEYIAEQTGEETDTPFLGTLDSAYEYPEIDTGDHQKIDEVIAELKTELQKAKENGFEWIVIVNAHGGNLELEKHLDEIREEVGIGLRMDSKICQIEGPHAGTGEVSIGAVIGITDESKIKEHNNLDNHPEIGFWKFEEAREKYSWAEEHAKKVIEEGVEIDRTLGRKLLRKAIDSAVRNVRELKKTII